MDTASLDSQAASTSLPALFEIHRLAPLPRCRTIRIEPDAFADDDSCTYAPAILSTICEWMDNNQSHTLQIRVSADKIYDIDLGSSLLQVLIQLPNLIRWIGVRRRQQFCLDIDRQGMHLRIEFKERNGAIIHACIEDYWQTAKRIEGDWSDTPGSLLQCCRSVAQEISIVGNMLHESISSLPAFRDWCVECGCDLRHETQ